jgi:hypothetical protein
MRDNKCLNSTAYGRVQAGRRSKQPRRSPPYGVTNCCFSLSHRLQEEVQKRKEEPKNSTLKLGQNFVLVLMFYRTVLSTTKLSLKGNVCMMWNCRKNIVLIQEQCLLVKGRDRE